MKLIKPKYGTKRPTLYELLNCRTKEVIKYRGYKIRIYVDDYGQQFYCFLDKKVVPFGSYNMHYEYDLKHLIDFKLDTLYKVRSGLFIMKEKDDPKKIYISYRGENLGYLSPSLSSINMRRLAILKANRRDKERKQPTRGE